MNFTLLCAMAVRQRPAQQHGKDVGVKKKAPQHLSVSCLRVHDRAQGLHVPCSVRVPMRVLRLLVVQSRGYVDNFGNILN